MHHTHSSTATVQGPRRHKDLPPPGPPSQSLLVWHSPKKATARRSNSSEAALFLGPRGDWHGQATDIPMAGGSACSHRPGQAPPGTARELRAALEDQPSAHTGDISPSVTAGACGHSARERRGQQQDPVSQSQATVLYSGYLVEICHLCHGPCMLTAHRPGGHTMRKCLYPAEHPEARALAFKPPRLAFSSHSNTHTTPPPTSPRVTP